MGPRVAQKMGDELPHQICDSCIKESRQGCLHPRDVKGFLYVDESHKRVGGYVHAEDIRHWSSDSVNMSSEVAVTHAQLLRDERRNADVFKVFEAL